VGEARAGLALGDLCWTANLAALRDDAGHVGLAAARAGLVGAVLIRVDGARASQLLGVAAVAGEPERLFLKHCEELMCVCVGRLLVGGGEEERKSWRTDVGSDICLVDVLVDV
jgi:hypothetical protein